MQMAKSALMLTHAAVRTCIAGSNSFPGETAANCESKAMCGGDELLNPADCGSPSLIAGFGRGHCAQVEHSTLPQIRHRL